MVANNLWRQAHRWVCFGARTAVLAVVWIIIALCWPVPWRWRWRAVVRAWIHPAIVEWVCLRRDNIAWNVSCQWIHTAGWPAFLALCCIRFTFCWSVPWCWWWWAVVWAGVYHAVVPRIWLWFYDISWYVSYQGIFAALWRRSWSRIFIAGRFINRFLRVLIIISAYSFCPSVAGYVYVNIFHIFYAVVRSSAAAWVSSRCFCWRGRWAACCCR